MIKKFPLLAAMLGLLAILAIPSFAGGPPPREGTWGDDQLYIMLSTKFPVPAADPSQEELYVIGAAFEQGSYQLIGSQFKLNIPKKKLWKLY